MEEKGRANRVNRVRWAILDEGMREDSEMIVFGMLVSDDALRSHHRRCHR